MQRLHYLSQSSSVSVNRDPFYNNPSSSSYERDLTNDEIAIPAETFPSPAYHNENIQHLNNQSSTDKQTSHGMIGWDRVRYGPMMCYNCGKLGHPQRLCSQPLRRQFNTHVTSVPQSFSPANVAGSESSPAAMHRPTEMRMNHHSHQVTREYRQCYPASNSTDLRDSRSSCVSSTAPDSNPFFSLQPPPGLRSTHSSQPSCHESSSNPNTPTPSQKTHQTFNQIRELPSSAQPSPKSSSLPLSWQYPVNCFDTLPLWTEPSQDLMYQQPLREPLSKTNNEPARTEYGEQLDRVQASRCITAFHANDEPLIRPINADFTAYPICVDETKQIPSEVLLGPHVKCGSSEVESEDLLPATVTLFLLLIFCSNRPRQLHHLLYPKLIVVFCPQSPLRHQIRHCLCLATTICSMTKLGIQTAVFPIRMWNLWFAIMKPWVPRCCWLRSLSGVRARCL